MLQEHLSAHQEWTGLRWVVIVLGKDLCKWNQSSVTAQVVVYPRPVREERARLGVTSHIVVVCELRGVGIDRSHSRGFPMGRTDRFAADLKE